MRRGVNSISSSISLDKGDMSKSRCLRSDHSKSPRADIQMRGRSHTRHIRNLHYCVDLSGLTSWHTFLRTSTGRSQSPISNLHYDASGKPANETRNQSDGSYWMLINAPKRRLHPGGFFMPRATVNTSTPGLLIPPVPRGRFVLKQIGRCDGPRVKSHTTKGPDNQIPFRGTCGNFLGLAYMPG